MCVTSNLWENDDQVRLSPISHARMIFRTLNNEANGILNNILESLLYMRDKQRDAAG